MKAVFYCRKGAESGLPRASNLGTMYRLGLGVGKDFNQALSWYHKAAVAGDADGISNLGYMYENGFGVLKDMKLAISLYGKAADVCNDWAKQSLVRPAVRHKARRTRRLAPRQGKTS